MRSVADAQQARKMPLPQPVDLHREQLDLIPAFEFARSPRYGAIRAMASRNMSSPSRLTSSNGTFPE